MKIDRGNQKPVTSGEQACLNIDKGGETKHGGGALSPSWSSIVKPILPKVLRNNESKSKKHRSSVVVTHWGKGILKNFENSMYQRNAKKEIQRNANEETSGRN